MTLLPLLLAAASTVGTEPQTAVLITRRTGVEPAEAVAYSQQVSDALRDEGFVVMSPDLAVGNLKAAGVKDTASCAGRKSCLVDLGKKLNLPTVVSVSVSDVGGDRTVALDWVRVSDGASLAKEGVLLTRKQSVEREMLKAFLGKARVALPKLAAPPLVPVPPENPPVVVERKVDDAPKRLPPPSLAPVAVEVTAPREPEVKSHTAAWVVGGAAAATAVAAGVFFLMASTDKRALDQRPEDLTRSQAEALAARANTNATVSLAGAGAALLLGAGAVVLW